jgi:hypothetical protein
MRRIVILLGAASIAFATGCPMPPSPAADMQNAAIELNTNIRFGRMELAIEHVAPTAREDFLAHRRAWGNSVQLADYEMVGAHMEKGDEAAEVSVRYSWYRSDQDELHLTTVRQKWKQLKGDWMLVSEARADGDPGLFGEAVPMQGEPEPPRNAQFPTVRFN